MLEPLFLELNQIHFSGELPIPKLRWNTRLSSSAGRFCPGSRNILFPRAPEIEIASYLRDLPDSAFHVRDTMLHEMVHYILWHRRRPYGHTAEFKEILRRVGARRYNPVPKFREYKYWYECPGCQKKIPARRQIKSSACLACCKQFNRGYFSEKFKLQLTSAPVEIKAPKTILRPAEPEKTAIPPGNPPEKRVAEPEILAQPSEIVRRLEEIKKMIMART